MKDRVRIMLGNQEVGVTTRYISLDITFYYE